MVLVGQDLAGHLARRDEGQLGDLRPDQLEGTAGLGLDLLRRVLEPALPLALELVAEPVALGFRDPAGLA